MIWSTGMGKSGHVAAIFAEWLCTHGVPAAFIPGGSLLHGGMGGVGGYEGDSIYLFTESGETSEIRSAAFAIARYTECQIHIVTANENHEFMPHHSIIHYELHPERDPTICQLIKARQVVDQLVKDDGFVEPLEWSHPANREYRAAKNGPTGASELLEKQPGKSPTGQARDHQEA